METQEQIRRIIEFMNIPDFRQIMSAKLLELEIALKPQIKHFQQLKSKFKKIAGNEMTLLETGDAENMTPAAKKSTGPAYYFELKRIKARESRWGQKWTVWDIHPEPVNSVPEALLKELSQSMSSYETDPDKIEYKEMLSTISHTYFDISFAKYSDTYAFGAIRQGSKKVKRTAETENIKNNMIKLNLGYRTFKKEDSYGELLRYLEAYPEIREHLLAYFYMVEKPLIDAIAG
jgi:hypothetical protein